MIGWLRRRAAADDGRWLVIDVETSGLDPQRDRLLAVAAVGVRASRTRLELLPGDSFEAVLRQPEGHAVDRANILLHGIGVGAQHAGIEPARVLADFIHFVGGAPLLGFHAAFDRAVLNRAARAQRLALPSPWADLADVGPALWPDAAETTLDDWLARHTIRCLARHQAAGDALATAELLQCWWPRLAAEGAWRFGALQRLAASRRWIA